MKLTNENYHSQEANQEYIGVSQYKDFCGSLGIRGCEAKALAKIKGEWEEEKTPALMVGSYVDAHFSGTLDVFKAQNPEILKKNGDLKSEYLKADEMILRIEKDKYFMKTLSGEKQVIMTCELFGAKWKIMIDSYHAGNCIVDLKTCQSIRKSFWVKDYGHVTFIEYFGYLEQLALYQECVRINTGKRIECLISVISKEKEPDIEVIGFDQKRLDEALRTIEGNIERIKQLKRGEIDPDNCGECDYCKRNKVLKGPIHYSAINYKTSY